MTFLEKVKEDIDNDDKLDEEQKRALLQIAKEIDKVEE
jgi:hypothetical protein